MAKMFPLTLFLALVVSLLWRLFAGALPNPPRLDSEEQDRVMREAIAACDRARGELVAWLFALPSSLWQWACRRLHPGTERAKDVLRSR